VSWDQFEFSQHAGEARKVTSTGSERTATTRSSELCGCRVAQMSIPSTR